MKHFIDHTQNVSKQTFSAGVIVDSKGKMQGKVVIRFTDAQIGYNHQVGVVFYPAEINFKDASKGGTYAQPDTLFYLLRDAGCKVYRRDGIRVIDYTLKDQGIDGQMYDSMSRFDEIEMIKYKRKTYRILWAM